MWSRSQVCGHILEIFSEIFNEHCVQMCCEKNIYMPNMHSNCKFCITNRSAIYSWYELQPLWVNPSFPSIKFHPCYSLRLCTPWLLVETWDRGLSHLGKQSILRNLLPATTWRTEYMRPCHHLRSLQHSNMRLLCYTCFCFWWLLSITLCDFSPVNFVGLQLLIKGWNSGGRELLIKGCSTLMHLFNT